MKIYYLMFSVALFGTTTTNVFTQDLISLTVKVDRLRNSVGEIQFSLYNTQGSIPDEHFENHCTQFTSVINNESSVFTFRNLPSGQYAINILHDENMDGSIDKGWVLPVEGVGFSNLKTINLFNRPSFDSTKFLLEGDTTLQVAIVYF
jgi:uncharacterized protein (DUF2141 family)